MRPATAVLPSRLVTPARLALPLSALPPSVGPSALPSLPAPGPNLLPAAALLGPADANSIGPRALPALTGDAAPAQPAAAGPTDDLETSKAFSDLSFDGRKPAPEAAPAVGEPASAPLPAAAPGDGGAPIRKIRFNAVELPEVVLRPDAPVSPHLVAAIDAAKESILLALPDFSLREVAPALGRAHRRGVSVRVVLSDQAVFPPDRGPERRSRRSMEVWSLLRDGIEVTDLRGLGKVGRMESSLAVFDGKISGFGSYRWSWRSEKAEVSAAYFSDNITLANDLTAHWTHLQSLGKPAASARDHAWPTTAPPPPAATARPVEFNGTRLPGRLLGPDPKLEATLAAAIDAAASSVDIAAPELRSQIILTALERAMSRGVKVRILADRFDAVELNNLFLGALAFRGAQVRSMPNVESPFAVFDGTLLETGSARWTKSGALNDFSDAHFIKTAGMVAAHAEFFERLFAAAQAVAAPTQDPAPPDEESLARESAQPVPARPPKRPVDPAPMPEANQVEFNGEVFPSSMFRPDHPIADTIVRAIDASRKSVRIAIHSFKSQRILEALRRAKARGIKVEAIIDYDHVYPSGESHTGGPRKPSEQIQALVKEGFAVTALPGLNGGDQHNKLAVFDGKMALAGSYNWDETAENNHFEDVLFTADAGRVAWYAGYWSYMRRLATPVKRGRFALARLGLLPERPADAPAGPRVGPPVGPPPEDTATPVRLHDEAFPRQMGSPRGKIEAALISAIGAARDTIEVGMFGFYSRPIAEALLAAKNRGVKIRLVLDWSQSNNPNAKHDSWFAWHGFTVRLRGGPDDEGDPMLEKLHDKFILIDRLLLIAGSYNYSFTAENKSFENVTFTNDAVDIARFLAHWARVFGMGWAVPRPDAEPTWPAPVEDSTPPSPPAS